MLFNMAVHGWLSRPKHSFWRAIFRLLGATQSIRNPTLPSDNCGIIVIIIFAFLAIEDLILLVHILDRFDLLFLFIPEQECFTAS